MRDVLSLIADLSFFLLQLTMLSTPFLDPLLPLLKTSSRLVSISLNLCQLLLSLFQLAQYGGDFVLLSGLIGLQVLEFGAEEVVSLSLSLELGRPRLLGVKRVKSSLGSIETVESRKNPMCGV